MAKTSIRSIYQQSNYLKGKISLLPIMTGKELAIFVKEAQALVDAARQAEQSTSSQETKFRLQNTIETWEEFLIDVKHKPIRRLPVISQVAKTSPAPTEFPLEEQITEIIRNFPSYIPGILSSSNKVDFNSPVTIPHDPELRAIYYELSGIR